MRQVTLETLDQLTLGATLLGTGGGGDPFIAKLMVEQAIRDYGPIDIVTLDELPDDAQLATVAIVGAPTVIIEKIPSGSDFTGAVRSLASYLGRDIDAIVPVEVGGMNTLVPLAVAAELGVPCVDADGMRRAFPQIEMTTFTLAGISVSPMSLADEKGNRIVFETVTNKIGETLVRNSAMNLGLANALAAYPMKAAQAKEAAVWGSTVCYRMQGKCGCDRDFRTLLASQPLLGVARGRDHCWGAWGRVSSLAEPSNGCTWADRT